MFEGGNYLVTGASSGIGLAVVRALLRLGGNVIGVARRPVELEISYETNLRSICCDLSDFEMLSSKVSETLRGNPLSGAVLAHGYGDFGSVEQFSISRIERLISVNLTSHIVLSRLIVPALKSNGGGDLVFIGSESALNPGRKGAIYCGTKFGLRGFAQSLRLDCAGANVRVGIVNPGMVETPFFDDLDFEPGESPDNRLQPKMVADAVMTMLKLPGGAVLDEINLSPLKTVIRKK